MLRTCHYIAPLATLLAVLCGSTPLSAMGFPVARTADNWTAERIDGVGVSSLRLELAPARAPTGSDIVWWVDETLVLQNFSPDPVEVHVAVPNAWSESDPSVRAPEGDFWAEVFVNGQPVETVLERLVVNPAHPNVTYRAARIFPLRLGVDESAHVRLLFALPAQTTALGEQQLFYPFHLRPLWDGPIAAGTIVLRWSDSLFGFRTNLPAYALYRDRAEWFVREFEPSSELEVRFLPQQAVFRRVAQEVGCPMPWELADRVADGRPEAVQTLLAAYDSSQLTLCAELPAALRGSAGAAERAGIRRLDLSQFMPGGSDIRGPLIIPDPAFDESSLSEAEQLYRRFLHQEVRNRRQ